MTIYLRVPRRRGGERLSAAGIDGMPELSQCTADTFVYIGADIDVQMLSHLLPWETRAVFVDPFVQSLQSVSYYTRNHRKDPRPAYRQTSTALRPWRGRAADVLMLRKLLRNRLRASGWNVSRPPVTSVGRGADFPINLSIRARSDDAQPAVRDGRNPTLLFFVEGVRSRAPFLSKELLKAAAGRTSSLCFLGCRLPAEIVAPLIDLLAPRCLTTVRVIGQELPTTLASASATRSRLSPWRGEDTLAGHQVAYEFTVPRPVPRGIGSDSVRPRGRWKLPWRWGR